VPFVVRNEMSPKTKGKIIIIKIRAGFIERVYMCRVVPSSLGSFGCLGSSKQGRDSMNGCTPTRIVLGCDSSPYKGASESEGCALWSGLKGP
jgi:hypothetical protein